MSKTRATALLLPWLWLPWLWLTDAQAIPPAVTDAELHAEERHRRATLIITHIMDEYHYRNKPLDDELSARILDSYLDSLDGNRSYFLAQDVADFAHYRRRLDEALAEAQLEPAFEIFPALPATGCRAC